MPVELSLLSRVAHRDRDVTGPRLRGLLALLATDLRTGASTTRLVDGLWPDCRPDNPAKALQILVSRARSQLGADVIVTTPTGYRLSLAEDQVDAAALLRCAVDAVRHARDGDHAASVAAADAGLALWDGSGDPLTDDPVSVLRAERRSAVARLRRARALALARLGRRAEAVEPLTELVGDHPRDEELLVELLRSEPTAAALTRYDAYRRALRDELGSDPGPELRAVHQELVRDDAPAVRRGVAHEPNPLLGRDADVAAVTELLHTSRVTSIVGPGGLGKTRLAHVVARHAEQRVVHLVGLAGVTADVDVAGEVASALGLGEAARHRATGAADVLTSILTALGAGRVLLVLDNCEHVLDGVSELTAALVSMTRDLRVLTTSRAPLGLSSESVYLLPELTLDVTVELFRRRAQAARPGVELADDAVEELCRHLDGLPLAVELAAARVRVLSVAEIAARLSDRFALLRGGPRDAPQRHRTLAAVVEWSWNLLDPPAQAAWRALSLFPGGFTASAAEHLVDDPAVLEQLVDHSLLTVTDTSSGTRFRMLETVREFGAARREAAGETERALDGLLAWARAFGIAHHDRALGPDLSTVAALIGAETDNLTFALRHGLARRDGAAVTAVTAVLGSLWMLQSDFLRLATLVADTSDVLVRFRPTDELVEVLRTAATMSVITVFQLHHTRAVRVLLVLRRLPPAPPNTLIRALAMVLAAVTGPDPTALPRLCARPEPLLAAVAHGVDSYVRQHGGDPDGALHAAGRMAELLTGRDVPWMWMMAHGRWIEMLLLAGDGGTALPRMREMATMLDGVGAGAVDAYQVYWAMALAHLQQGDLDEADRLLAAAGPRSGSVTFDVEVQAEIALARGDIDGGLALWRRAVDRLRDPDGVDLDPSGLAPWALEMHATSVVAHARHGRLDLVPEVAAELPHTLAAMLDTPVDRPPAYFVVYPLWGTFLLALAAVDLAGDGDRSVAARMIALAQALHYPRQFPVTMSGDRAREAAVQADGPAYDAAVSSYAGLDPEALRRAAQELLHQRDGSRS